MIYGIYNGYGVGSMMGFGGGIIMLFFWIAVVIFIVWVIKELIGKNLDSNHKALDILKERYVKGEISKEEFDSIKKDIV